MHDSLPIEHTLSPAALDALATRGFIVLPGFFSTPELLRLQEAYDTACACAAPEDVRVGRTSTRVSDFVNRGAEFDAVYTCLPALDAARSVLKGPCRLSALHARTLHAGATADALHVDVPRASDAWPMLGMILMVDEFRSGNGATRFVPGSHHWPDVPEQVRADCSKAYEGELLACGPAGSVILFNTSTWHGHTANSSGGARRSLQATYIPRAARPATDFLGRMQADTLRRLGAVARYLVGLEETV